MLHRVLTFLISRLLLSLNVDCRQLVVRWKYTGSLLLRSLAVSDRQLTPLFCLKSAYVSSISLHVPWSVFWSGHKAISLHIDTVLAVVKPQSLVRHRSAGRGRLVENGSQADTRLLRGRRRRDKWKDCIAPEVSTGFPAHTAASCRSRSPGRPSGRKTRASPSPMSLYASADERGPRTGCLSTGSQGEREVTVGEQRSHLDKTLEVGVLSEESCLVSRSASTVHHDAVLGEEAPDLHCSSAASFDHTDASPGRPPAAEPSSLSVISSSGVSTESFFRTLARRLFRAVVPSSLDPFSSVFVSSLLLRLLKRASVHLTNVQICLEDDTTTPSSPFQCGLSFSALSFTSTRVLPPTSAPQTNLAVSRDRPRVVGHNGPRDSGSLSFFSSSMPKLHKTQEDAERVTNQSLFFPSSSDGSPTFPEWGAVYAADGDPRIELLSCLPPAVSDRASQAVLLSYLDRCGVGGSSAGGEVEDGFLSGELSGRVLGGTSIRTPEPSISKTLPRERAAASASSISSARPASPEHLYAAGEASESSATIQPGQENVAVGDEAASQSVEEVTKCKDTVDLSANVSVCHPRSAGIFDSPGLLPRPPDHVEPPRAPVLSANTRLLSPTDPSLVAAELIGVSSTAIASNHSSCALPLKRTASDPELHLAVETPEEVEEESEKPLEWALSDFPVNLGDDERCGQEKRAEGTLSERSRKGPATSRLETKRGRSSAVERSNEGEETICFEEKVTRKEARTKGVPRFTGREHSFVGPALSDEGVRSSSWRREVHENGLGGRILEAEDSDRASKRTSLRSTGFSGSLPVCESTASAAGGHHELDERFLSFGDRASGPRSSCREGAGHALPYPFLESGQDRLLFRQLLEVDGLSFYWNSRHWEMISHSNTGPLTRSFRRRFARGESTGEATTSVSPKDSCPKEGRDGLASEAVESDGEVMKDRSTENR